MKQFLCCLLLLSLPFAHLLAQAPQKMSYQAVVRNAANQLVINGAVGMEVTILQGTINGTPVYSETHATTTNANGLVSLEIGTGVVQSGSFSTISWGNGPYFIQTEIDPTGGINYSITGTSQLVSVPYALYAETAGNATGGCGDKVELLEMWWTANTTSTNWVEGPSRYKFDKTDYCNVDSITWYVSLRIAPGGSGYAEAELYDLATGQTIAGSNTQSTNTISWQPNAYTETHDLYSTLPNQRTTLGIRVRSSNGQFSSVDRSFLVIYRK